MINSINIFISFVGGLALFIYGMTIMSKGFQKAAGEKMSSLIAKATSNKLLAILIGALTTMLVQSSSATTVMVVGFVNAGIMNLFQSVGIIMGANIGTTVTSWIVASSEFATFLKPTTLAPLMVAIGVVIRLTSKTSKKTVIGDIIIGFGILFIGMNNMSSAVKPFRDSQFMIDAFVSFGNNPILGVLAGVVVTFMVQSSSASMGILLALASQGLVPFSAAIYIIAGQNIGTCFTALISSIGASKSARAASYIHFLFNIIGSTIFIAIFLIVFRLPFAQIFTEVTTLPSNLLGTTFYKLMVLSQSNIVATTAISLTGISIIHTVFNISSTILLYPFSNKIVVLAAKLAKVDLDKKVVIEGDAVFLDERLLENPSVALERVHSEISRLGGISREIFSLAGKTIYNNNKDLHQNIDEIENNIDTIEHDITTFVTETMKKGLSSHERILSASYLHILSNIERVADHCVNISEGCKYLTTYETSFSERAISDLNNVLDLSYNCLDSALISFDTNDLKYADVCCDLENQIDDLVDQLRSEHINRLSTSECTPEAGIIYWDVLSNLERISDHSKNIVECVQKNEK